LVASGIEDEPAAAKKQCQIRYPDPLASSSESPNLKLELSEKWEEWKRLEQSQLICCRMQSMFKRDFPDSDFDFGSSA